VTWNETCTHGVPPLHQKTMAIPPRLYTLSESLDRSEHFVEQEDDSSSLNTSLLASAHKDASPLRHLPKRSVASVTYSVKGTASHPDHIGFHSDSGYNEPNESKSTGYDLPARPPNIKSRVKHKLLDRLCTAIFVLFLSLFLFATLLCLILVRLPDAQETRPKTEPDTERLDERCEMLTDTGIQLILSVNSIVAQGLTYSGVRGIDISWNLVVGQGGRALLGWISYIVFSDALSRSLETLPGTYEFYSSVSFNTTAISSALVYAKSFCKFKGLKRSWLLGWIFISTVGILLWPSIVGASAGYVHPIYC
jgi:hypothetical protein